MKKREIRQKSEGIKTKEAKRKNKARISEIGSEMKEKKYFDRNEGKTAPIYFRFEAKRKIWKQNEVKQKIGKLNEAKRKIRKQNIAKRKIWEAKTFVLFFLLEAKQKMEAN
jgi:hypothetical protein